MWIVTCFARKIFYSWTPKLTKTCDIIRVMPRRRKRYTWPSCSVLALEEFDADVVQVKTYFRLVPPGPLMQWYIFAWSPHVPLMQWYIFAWSPHVPLMQWYARHHKVPTISQLKSPMVTSAGYLVNRDYTIQHRDWGLESKLHPHKMIDGTGLIKNNRPLFRLHFSVTYILGKH